MDNLPDQCEGCTRMCFCEDGSYRCFHVGALTGRFPTIGYKDFKKCAEQNTTGDCGLPLATEKYWFEVDDVFDIQYPERDKGIRMDTALEQAFKQLRTEEETGQFLIVELNRTLNYGQMRKLLPSKIWLNGKPEFLCYLRHGDEIKTSLKWLDRTDTFRKVFTIRCIKKFKFIGR